ncbi:MAG: hypothetical protein HY040_04095 [Planctomycetes bacterium]|nr:hypothetical protein [Planctomycetota bacterium]
MARPIRSIEIYLPLDYNDGRAIPESKFVSLQQELLNRFGGVTSIQREFPLQGVWQRATNVYCDRVVVFSVMDFREGTQLQCLRYLERFKERCKKKFEQLEVLITVAELLAV